MHVPAGCSERRPTPPRVVAAPHVARRGGRARAQAAPSIDRARAREGESEVGAAERAAAGRDGGRRRQEEARGKRAKARDAARDRAGVPCGARLDQLRRVQGQHGVEGLCLHRCDR